MNASFKAALLTENNHFIDEVKASSTEEKTVRLNVYRNNIFVSLIDALADIFPVTQRLVGETFFRAMAREFITHNPPKTPLISDYGDDFPDFLRNFPPVQSLPYLADLAALERHLLTLTHDEEHSALEQVDIAAAFDNASDPSRLRLTLPANCQILHSSFSIGAIYLAHQGTDNAPMANVTTNRSEHLLIFKNKLYGEFRIISVEESSFLSALLAHKTLEEAVPNSDQFDLGTTLAKLIEWQLFTDISVSEKR